MCEKGPVCFSSCDCKCREARVYLDTFGLHKKLTRTHQNESVVRGHCRKIGPGDLVLVGLWTGTLTQAPETEPMSRVLKSMSLFLPNPSQRLKGMTMKSIHGDILRLTLKDITGQFSLTVARTCLSRHAHHLFPA